MRTNALLTSVAIWTSALAQQETVRYQDPETGITFASITHANGASYRVALPINSTSSDAVLQIVAPKEFQWCGLAWGGHMTNNPLSVSWTTGATSGQKAIVSNRMAYSYYAVPQQYDGAEHTYLKGTTSNDTHWQVTARCQGCTRWSSADGDIDITTVSETVFAYACSSYAPDTPNSNTSQFNIHEQFGIWNHNLDLGRSESFGDWIRNNPYEASVEV
ncbi:iron reductase domain protein [Aaosphaeria arxii CBS 175.79]|uniref:Iron reductase domain protein n=1 Tax=Aaosphaeria arxii CBS 175.79 TaxID=1450172 RepID=A0A6A5XQS7_9PLEO|nr:iron reductase domain protein [Aaosphaeria arxii CBS 175.79]KAF2015249.1 iron reductase domain protein [Aaosphaeria arxii CBS 175.79]